MNKFLEWLKDKLEKEGYLPDEAESHIKSAKWIIEELNRYQLELWDEGLDEENRNSQKEN